MHLLISEPLMPEIDLENTTETMTALKAHEQALEAYNNALKIYRQIGERFSEANVQRKVGTTLRARGENEQGVNVPIRFPPPPPPPRYFDEALEAYKGALTIYQEENNLMEQANTLVEIGNTYFSIGKSMSRVVFE